VPTVAESGFPGFDTSAWFAVLVAKKTPEPVRATIEHAIVDVLAMPDVRSLLKNAGIVAAAEGSADLLHRVKEESTMWNGVLTKAHIKLE
jgi:tripartite-type tricarboxylate transporter receptor subunit TctC